MSAFKVMIMFDDEFLVKTETALSSSGDQTKTDPAFPLYKKGIKNALKDFIAQIKQLPIDQQMDSIASQVSGKTDLINDLEQESNKKETWTLLFALAATAIERRDDLPEDHKERKHLDQLMSGFRNGWVNSFGSLGFGITLNKSAINDLMQGLKGWLGHYDISQGESTSHEALLSLYATVCYLEKKMAESRFVPSEYKADLSGIKLLIEGKFAELQIKQVSKQEAVIQIPESHISSALHLLGQNREDTPYRKFSAELDILKKAQQEVQHKIETFPLEKYHRMAELQQLLQTDDPLKSFWTHYDTQEKFSHLISDLELPESQKAGWQQYYNYQHGSLLQQGLSTLWTGGYGLPTALGGIKSDLLSHEKLVGKCTEVLSPLQVTYEAIQKRELDKSQGEEAPAQLIEEIENEIVVLGGELKEIKLETLGEHLYELAKEHNTERSKLKTIQDEIAAFREILSKQQKIATALENIQQKMESLSRQGVDDKKLNESFDSILNHIYKVVSLEYIFPYNLTAPEDKINYIKKFSQRVSENVNGIKLSIDSLVDQIKEQSANKQSEIIQFATDFVTSYEKKLGHRLLCFFSSAYRDMFDTLKNTVNDINLSEETRYNSIADVLDLAKKYSEQHSLAKVLFSEVSELQEMKAEADAPLSNESFEIEGASTTEEGRFGP